MPLTVNGKNDFVLSHEGVAKLSFSFLDEHHADSSLEPGEVKTPPQSPSSKNSQKTSNKSAVEDESAAKRLLKTASQLENAVCKNKISAILELEAINQRKKDAEQIKEKGKSQIAENENTMEKKDGAKESRRRRKSRKKESTPTWEQHETYSDDGSTDRKRSSKNEKKNTRKRNLRNHTSGDERGRSSSNDRSRSKERSFNDRTAYHPNQFMGFRQMNPFGRPPRHDFHHYGRGSFYSRGRGGNMRGGGMHRFPTFRHQTPHTNFHSQKHSFFNRDQSPYSHRKDDWKNSQSSLSNESMAKVFWTKTKPSLSYAFKVNNYQKKLEEIPTEETENEEKPNKKDKKLCEKDKLKKHSEQFNKKHIEKINQSEKSNCVTESKANNAEQETKIVEMQNIIRQEKIKPETHIFDMFAESPPRHENSQYEEIKKPETEETILKNVPNCDETPFHNSEAANNPDVSTTPPQNIIRKTSTRTAAARKEFSFNDSRTASNIPYSDDYIENRIEKSLSPNRNVELDNFAGASETPPQENDSVKHKFQAKFNPFKENSSSKCCFSEKNRSKHVVSKQREEGSRSLSREKNKYQSETKRNKRSKSRHSSHSEDNKYSKNTSTNRLQSKSPEKREDQTDKNRKNKKKSKKLSKITKKTPLSFTADEFLFPENEADSDENGSPDTDDYMDNWENDDIELNSNLTGESSTPKNSFKEEPVDDDVFDKKLFVNPSPPRIDQNSEDDIEEESLTPPPISKSKLKDIEIITKNSDVQKMKISSQKEGSSSDFSILPLMKEASETGGHQALFGMQEIYDQFIRSVEESGIDMKVSARADEAENPSNTPPINSIPINKPKKDSKRGEEISTPSTSTTSSWSSASSTSSSSSSMTTSSSDDSNDGQSSKKSTENDEEINDVDKIKTPPSKTETVVGPKPVSKSVASKDLKKLNNLEANLARIQMMRANYDSVDDISEELQKMENLFLQEKKLILQKYAKVKTSNAAATSPDIQTKILVTNVTEANKNSHGGGGQFVPSMQESSDTMLAAKAEINDETNKIFDANREAIRLTISPNKLPKTVIAAKIDKLKEKHKDEEVDFTEKLQKPPKEIAIVKPMMETNDSRSSSRRSPDIDRGGYRRRSTSRPRNRTNRVRSISTSPPRRSRFFSPSRRGVGAHQMPPYSSSTSGARWRNSRRSRSRSRSDSRQLRRSDNSPAYRRRRRADVMNHRKSRSVHSRSHSLSPGASSRDRRRSRSTSYGRGYSRSPLPFKPPSPPMRESMSPECRRSRRSHSVSRSRSPSPAYSDAYDNSQRQYYSQQMGGPSSYYYNVSPNRISLDARINIVLNSANPDQTATITSNNNPYEGYNYSTYGYMSLPPQPGSHPMNYPINYANQYVPMNETATDYSNIPTIGTSSNSQQQAGTVNFYYGEYGHRLPLNLQNQITSSQHQQPPKAVAVQKGNVLEIVPSELPSQSSTTATVTPLVSVKCESRAVSEPTAAASQKVIKPKVKKIRAISWKEEVNNRHVQAAVLRLSRESEGLSKGILKNIVPQQTEEKAQKKKVYFEDGIFPNRDSGDEDRRAIDAKIRRKLRQLRKRHGVKIIKENQENLETTSVGSILEIDFKIDPELENAPPPPPPPGSPPAHLEQPVYLKPPTPTPFFYFHYDAVVHSMYVSQMETAIPPRLLNPKLVPPILQTAAGTTNVSPAATNNPTGMSVSLSTVSHGTITQSPSETPSPIGSAAAKKDSMTSNISRSVRLDRCSPKMVNTKIVPLRDTSSLKASPIETVVNTARHSLSPTDALSPRSFGSIQHIHQGMPVQVTARQSPIGFTGMRMGSFMRLPPSPLARAIPPMASLGVRHTFSVPPPNISTVTPHPQAVASEMPQQFYHNQAQHLPTSQIHQHPHHPPPQFFMRGHSQQSPMRLPLLPTPPNHSTVTPVVQHLTVNPEGSTPNQAMVAPFNITRQ